MAKRSTRACLVDEDGNLIDGTNPLDVGMGQGVHLDAFGRLRVSNPMTIFDSKQIFDNQPVFWDDSEVSGSGTTSTHNVDAARSRLAVGTTAGKRIRQTFMSFNYQPGKSQLVMMTTRLISSPSSGVVSEVGLFNNNNGVFFRMNGTVLEVVIRSNVTGSPVDTAVPQSNFNSDKMDGTGKSGITVDTTKTQILWFDLEWLGVGSVRMGVVIDDKFHVMHTFNNSNVLDVVYMSTPNLPLRYSIENDGTGAETSMDQLCASVISEGGSDDLGVLRHKNSGTNVITCPDVGTIYPIFGIQLKSTHIGSFISPNSVDVLVTAGNKSAEWSLILNPTLSAGLTYVGLTNSAVQTANGNGTITATGGIIVAGGYWQSTQRGGISGEELSSALRLGALIDGTRDELVLCVTPITGTSPTVLGAMTWRETP